MERILLANSNAAESMAIRSHLERVFDVNSVASPDEYVNKIADYQLVLVDANFTECDGIDFAMEILSSHYVPLIFLCAEDNPKTAEEALNIGAFNFIVKVKDYISLIPFAIKEAIKRSNAHDTLTKTIVQLRERVKQLEEQLKISTQGQEGESNESRKSGVASLVPEITRALRAGEVNLPSYPKVVESFNELARNGSDIEDIVPVLEKDPSITSKLISVSNSIHYKGMAPISSVKQAIGRIGIADTRNYVELIANRGLYTVKDPNFKEFLDKLWQHSLLSAYISQGIARQRSSLNPAEMFTLGLFHDIGKLLLVQILAMLSSRDAFNRKLAKEEWLGLVEREHNNFGASLMKKWKLSEAFSYAILWHERVTEAKDLTEELCCIHVANTVAVAMADGSLKRLAENPPKQITLQKLRLTCELLIEIGEEAKELMRSCDSI